ncbi:MAG: ArnT family glycosyltransferase [Acidobacteriaceae bacterium]
MAISSSPSQSLTHSTKPTDSRRRATILIAVIFMAVYFGSLFSPSLLDDADATHADAARHVAITGNWVTLYVNGIRYLEKPPLPYWVTAIDYHIFGFNVFATHLPIAIAVLLLTLLARAWARRAYGERAATYAALGVLTSVGVFLFTRYFIPDVVLTLFLGISLYCFLLGLELRSPVLIYGIYVSLACAVLTKGLVAPVFFVGSAILYLWLTGEWHRWRELRLFSGTLLFLALAAPWHILAGLRNPSEGHPGPIPTYGNHYGFFWFYFINEHVLRFLGKRYPDDYNKLPGYLFWSLHLVWLFPWSLFFPIALKQAWQRWKQYRASKVPFLVRLRNLDFTGKSTLLLSIYAAVVLVFFSISTNQEYYTFPAYLPLLVLTAAALARAEKNSLKDSRPSRWLTGAHAFYAIVGIGVALALGEGVWTARHLPFEPDIGALLAHRGVGDYTLSMSHFFDLTGRSFAALRMPAALAMVAFALGPWIAWRLRSRRRDFSSTVAIALTSAVFLIAAHIALGRFEPMLSSRAFADTINRLTKPGTPGADDVIYMYGDQSYGSSIPFYTGRVVDLVNGRSSSMIWGSTYTDAPHIFLTNQDLLANWGKGPRKLMFVPLEKRDQVDALLGNHQYIIQELSGKTLITDRPFPK